MKRLKKLTFCFALIILIATIFTSSDALFAQTGDNEERGSIRWYLKTTGGRAYYNDISAEPASPTVIIGRIIQTVMGFLGLLFTVLILYSGFQWMMAGGNQDTIGKARQRIISAVIGLIIVLGVFAITEFVLERALSSVA